MSSTQPAATPRRRPKGRPDACSAQWDGVADPAWGTAAGALFWVAIEQPGPWGSHAFQASRMDPGLGRALNHQSASHGGRALLIRKIGSQRETETARTRRVYVAGGMPHWQPWLLSADLADVADLLRLPWSRLRYGDQRAVLEALPALRPDPTPLLLVCTNAKRDVCCAVRGRPLAADAAAALPGQVWECTHTGGHRFAPTGVVLPHGQTLARLTPELAVDALRAAAEGRLATSSLDPRYNRGLPHVMPQLQAAEAWVRHQTGETGVGCVRARTTRPLIKGQSGVVEVEHRDGRHWLLHVRQVESTDDLRRNSCSTAAVPVTTWTVEPVAPDVPVLGAWPAWPEPEPMPEPSARTPRRPTDVPATTAAGATTATTATTADGATAATGAARDTTAASDAPSEVPSADIVAALWAREPLLHRRDVVATAADLDRELAPDFWQWGVSGTRYDRDTVVATTTRRLAVPGPDPYETQGWRLEDPAVRRLGPDTYQVTYTLHGQLREDGLPSLSRRATLWRGSPDRGWQALFHQGTPVADPAGGSATP